MSSRDSHSYTELEGSSPPPCTAMPHYATEGEASQVLAAPRRSGLSPNHPIPPTQHIHAGQFEFILACTSSQPWSLAVMLLGSRRSLLLGRAGNPKTLSNGDATQFRDSVTL